MALKMRDAQAFKLGAMACLLVELTGNYLGSRGMMLLGPAGVIIFGLILEGFTEEAIKESNKRRLPR